MRRILETVFSVLLIAVLAITLAACDSSFSIEGKWKNVGDDTYGQVQTGSIVAFDGTNCNVVSPSDTYSLTKDGDDYRLDCTTMLFSQTISFDVDVIDNDNIQLKQGSTMLELERVG